MANPVRQSSAPPASHLSHLSRLSQRDRAVPLPHNAGGRLLPVFPGSPALPALPALRKRPTAGWARGCLIAVNLAAVTFFLLSYSRHGVSFGPYHIDLNVYRIGSAVWLRGGDLYGVLPPTSIGVRLPFSYPPIAAVLLAPLALVPMPVAATLLTALTIALTALVLRLFLRSAFATPTQARPLESVFATPTQARPLESVFATPTQARALESVFATPTQARALAASPDLSPARASSAVSPFLPIASWRGVWWLLPAALFLEPVRNTLNYGQVNVALMALVAADCLLAAPRWPRGALVGIAAAVKLTPAAFVLFFLLRRDWRAAGVAALSFSACAGIGFLLAWHDSVEYWTSVVFQAGRPGSPAYAANQSIQGVLARAGLDPRSLAGAVTWLALSAVVVVVACLGMRRAFAASADAWALSLNAFAGLLVSPISWSHHWVWGEMAVLTLAILGWRRWARDRRDCRDRRDRRDRRDSRDSRDRSGRDRQDSRDNRDHRDNRDSTGHRDSRDSRDRTGRRDGKEIRERPGRLGRPDRAARMAGLPCLAIAAVGAVMFAVSPQWWLPNGGNRELHWAAWEQAVGSSYVIFAAVVLLAACLADPAGTGKGSR